MCCAQDNNLFAQNATICNNTINSQQQYGIVMSHQSKSNSSNNIEFAIRQVNAVFGLEGIEPTKELLDIQKDLADGVVTTKDIVARAIRNISGENAKKLEHIIASCRWLEIIQGAVDLPPKFGLERLVVTHKHIFGDLYSWAGKLRKTRSSKAMPTMGLMSIFAEPQDIESNWRELEDIIDDFVLQKEADFESRLKHLVTIFAKANFNHPFMDGNGRTLQLFIFQLAQLQGINLDYTKVPSPKVWCDACGRSGFHGEVLYGMDGKRHLNTLPPDLQPLTNIFFEIASSQMARK